MPDGKGPDIVIAVADKAMRKKKGEEKKEDVFQLMAKDMVKAIKDEDTDLLARILEAAANGVS